ncbi:hypothetical protein NPX13_g6629 [Xylaria arbuscula]|uniref:Uncharacterized protein n=1 Tax=Xylaria arbuscula TaxID=114810 RepID=A0A9W8TLK2_9PEZI|nr:hypothetical protein NPX13_g6629 [Xylaria arbuscula]
MYVACQFTVPLASRKTASYWVLKDPNPPSVIPETAPTDTPLTAYWVPELMARPPPPRGEVTVRELVWGRDEIGNVHEVVGETVVRVREDGGAVVDHSCRVPVRADRLPEVFGGKRRRDIVDGADLGQGNRANAYDGAAQAQRHGP